MKNFHPSVGVGQERLQKETDFLVASLYSVLLHSLRARGVGRGLY